MSEDTVEHQEQPALTTEAAPTMDDGASVTVEPRKRPWLKPPWRPGQSGNPTGLRKDGTSPKGQKLAASLLARLEKPGTMDRIAQRWVSLALKGSYPHLNALLERLYPVEAAAGGKQALEAIRLELGPGQASVTLLRGLQGQLPASSSSGDGALEGPTPAG